MHRYLSLIAGVTLQVCLGGIYAFSAYVPSLAAEFGYSSGEGQIVFGCTIALMTLIMPFAGRLYGRWGPQVLILVCAVFFTTGHLLTSFFGGSFVPFFLSYSVMIGVAAGFGYVCPIVVAIGWFPKKKGLVTGLTVAGYGAGGVLLSFLVEIFLARTQSVLEVFRLVGIIYGAAILFCAVVIRRPPPAEKKNVPGFKLKWLLKSPGFYALCAGMMFGTLPGLLLIGNLKPIGISFGFSPETAVTAVMVLSIGNGAGRLSWGHIHDHARPRSVALVIFAAIGLSVAGMVAGQSYSFLFLATSFLIGFFYGGNLSVYPLQTALLYHPENVAKLYPLVMMAHGLAAVIGAPVGGLLRDMSGSFDLTLIVAAAAAFFGLFVYLLLSRHEKALGQKH